MIVLRVIRIPDDFPTQLQVAPSQRFPSTQVRTLSHEDINQNLNVISVEKRGGFWQAENIDEDLEHGIEACRGMFQHFHWVFFTVQKKKDFLCENTGRL